MKFTDKKNMWFNFLRIKKTAIVISLALILLSLNPPHLSAFPSNKLPNEKAYRDSVAEMWSMIEAGRLDEAEKSIRQVLKNDPKNLEIHATFGYFFLEKGEWNLAARQFQWVLRKGTDISSKSLSERRAISLSYLGFGKIFLLKTDYEKAKASLLKACQIFENAVAYSMLGVIMRYEKNYSLSETMHKKILWKYPHHFEENKIFLAILYVEENKKIEAEYLISQIREPNRHLLEMAAYYSVAGDFKKSYGYLKYLLNKYKSSHKYRFEISEFIRKGQDFKNFRQSSWMKRLNFPGA